jgi:hypothetical protein
MAYHAVVVKDVLWEMVESFYFVESDLFEIEVWISVVEVAIAKHWD